MRFLSLLVTCFTADAFLTYAPTWQRGKVALFMADIVETASESDDFKTLVAAIDSAGLSSTLRSQEFTVFAPTDNAFQKLPMGTVGALLQDIPQLSSILTYHVVPGKIMSQELTNNQKLKTVNGAELTVTVNENGVTINNGLVSTADILCDNGVIHAISSVLIPKSVLTPEELKSKLFAFAASVDRGFGAKQSERESIQRIVDELIAQNPTEVPTLGLFPDNQLGKSSPLAGAWKMVYTTAFDVLSLAASPVSTLQAIYQVIGSDGASVNIIDLSPRAEAALPFRQFGSTLRLQVTTAARARSDRRVGLTFLGVKAVPLIAFGFDVSKLLPPVGFNFPQLSLFGLGAESKASEDTPGFFDVLYLDDDCLIISQNEPGGIFISTRATIEEVGVQ